MTVKPPSLTCSILLLAGGRGARMGGQDKGLLEWHGKPLIAHLHAVVRPFSDELIISCNRHHAQYAAYADRLVSDDSDDFPGPLAGLRSGLAAARHSHLLTLPCDVPGVDAALLSDLLNCAAEHPDHPVMLRHGAHWEPLIAVIPVRHREAFDSAWHNGERSPRQVMLALGATALDCPSPDPRLANFNTPDTLTN